MDEQTGAQPASFVQGNLVDEDRRNVWELMPNGAALLRPPVSEVTDTDNQMRKRPDAGRDCAA